MSNSFTNQVLAQIERAAETLFANTVIESYDVVTD